MINPNYKTIYIKERNSISDELFDDIIGATKLNSMTWYKKVEINNDQNLYKYCYHSKTKYNEFYLYYDVYLGTYILQVICDDKKSNLDIDSKTYDKELKELYDLINSTTTSKIYQCFQKNDSIYNYDCGYSYNYNYNKQYNKIKKASEQLSEVASTHNEEYL